jgi:tRNA 2-selenouridine synthase
MEYLDPISFLHKLPDIPVVDVRSPVEYEKGHITGAINIPILSDEERTKIGTIYQQKGKIPAIEKGLELVGPKMRAIADNARSISEKGQLKVYCWRGGMRSEKMSWLFELVGISCHLLKGGFKAYRNQLLRDFKELPKLMVLQGQTGSGKTDVLFELSQMGEQVIDLEGLAHHRGSAFGHIGMEEQPTSLQFQNDLHNKLLTLDREKIIWIESESLSIGKVYLPETLWDNINRATVMELSIPKDERVKRLVEEYGKFDKKLLTDATLKISKKFGRNNVRQVLEFLHNDDLEGAASLLLNYYDRSYQFSQKKYKKRKALVVESDSGDPKINAEKLLNKTREIIFKK